MKCKLLQFSIFNFQLLLFLLLTACFSAREVEAPDKASNWTPPNQPEVLLTNFAAALAELNVANYERCFVKEDYVFYPDPTVARNNQGLFANWTLQTSELEYVRNLLRVRDVGGTNRLLLKNQRTNNVNADSVEVLADYELYIYQTDTSYRQYRFEGNMILSLSRNAYNEWAIGRWRDTKTNPAQPCWTELKQKFATR